MRIVAIFVFTFMLCAWSPGGFAQVRFNEILADPVADWDGDGARSSRNDEWIEIVNVGTSTVDLSCYRAADASGGFDWRYGFSGLLAPGEVRVVYGSDSVAWEHANGFPAFGLSLNNAGDTVFLYDVLGGDTLIVDQYTYQSFQVLDDRSTGRSPDGNGQWVVFDGLNPYLGSRPPLGTGCAPTPGGVNCIPAVPVEESTWGAVKHLYRS